MSFAQLAHRESLRDIQAMMYNPKFDRSNKEYDKSGKLTGWWVIVPATDCSNIKPSNAFEPHTATKYSLVRISRICAGSPAGCQQTAGPQDAPAAACGSGCRCEMGNAALRNGTERALGGGNSFPAKD